MLSTWLNSSTCHHSMATP